MFGVPRAIKGADYARPRTTAGVAAFIVITVGQALATLARGGTRRTLFPYGPAIAVAFLVASVL